MHTHALHVTMNLLLVWQQSFAPCWLQLQAYEMQVIAATASRAHNMAIVQVADAQSKQNTCAGATCITRSHLGFFFCLLPGIPLCFFLRTLPPLLVLLLLIPAAHKFTTAGPHRSVDQGNVMLNPQDSCAVPCICRSS
jgi:hypothetical protein